MGPLGVSAERFFHLDGWNGWRLVAACSLEVGREGIALPPAGDLPRGNGLKNPLEATARGLAFDWTGQPVAVSRDRSRLCRAGLATPEAWALPEPAPGRFGGLAADARGRLYVALPAAGEVRVLRQSPLGEIARVTGLRPAAIAVSGAGRLYVLEEPGAAAPVPIPSDIDIVRVACAGDALAVGPGGLLAIVGTGRQQVLVGHAGGPLLRIDLGRPCLPAVAFDPGSTGDAEAILFIGDALSGRIVRHRLDLREGRAKPLAWSNELDAWGALVHRGGQLFGLGDRDAVRPITMEADGFHAAEGRVVLGPLDSGVQGTEWHRVTALVDGITEGQTSVLVEVLAADDDCAYAADPEDSDPRWTDAGALVFPRRDRPGELALSAREWSTHRSGPLGRYAWIRLTLRGDGRRTPRVRWVRLELPRSSYLRYLPAIFSGDPELRDFSARFLSLFEAEHADLGARIDELYRLFTPLAADPELLPWLAERIGLHLPRSWSVRERRTALAAALPLYRRRGTREAMETMLRFYGGPGVRVVEDRSPAAAFLVGPEAPAVLGATTTLPRESGPPRMELAAGPTLGHARLDPGIAAERGPGLAGHPEIVVYVPTTVSASAEQLARFTRLAEREAPAGAAVRIVPVGCGIALGERGRLDLDAALDRRTPFRLPGENEGGDPRHVLLTREPGTGADLDLGTGPRIGMDSRL